MRRTAMLLALSLLTLVLGAAGADALNGSPATPQPIVADVPPQNPFLAPDGTSSMHNDAYGTNAYQVGGPLGRSLQVTSRSYGVSECATIAFDSRGRIVGLCGGLQGFALRLIDPVTLRQIATLTTSTRSLTSLSNPFADICGGTYFYLDAHDVATVVTTAKTIIRVRVGASSLTRIGTYDVAADVPGKDCLVATMPDWSGDIFFATQQGRVGVIAASTGAVHTIRFPGEGIFNSMSGDETGAVYVVTDHRLYAIAADADGVPRVRWSTAYDRGSVKKPGQLSQGSGTTPTLLDDGLIAITDNADPRMHVQFYSRTGPTAGQLVCQAPVFGAGTSDTENSLAKAGPHSVVVENNYGYRGVQSTIAGMTSSPGVAKVTEADGSCTVDWTNPIVAPTSVPKTSLANGLVYVYAKPRSNLLDDSWYLAALDIRTGRTQWMQRTGNGIQWNNHYASIYLGPDGAAYIATLAGLIRFKDGAS
ncbi:MAG TPA: hypothetical protein VN088_14545 [Nocardioides sp.]|nr:hypothetical protein [Nocardioides sp.]